MDQRTVTISMPPTLADEVDRIARAEGRTRSELVREALRQYMERTGRWEQIFAHGEALAKERGLREEDVLAAVKRRRRTRRRA